MKFMKTGKQSYNYGKCHVCGEQMIEKTVNQDFWVKKQLVVIEDVPTGVCPQCGEKIVKADVGRRIGSLLSKKLQPVRQMTVPIVRLAEERAQ
jgi:YgiT-type zinc finger domain-containing protein